MRILAALLAFSAASAATASDEVPFEPSAENFKDAAACRARLVGLVAEARSRNPVAAQGPYEIAKGDVRIHSIVVAGAGHSITEHRCLAEKLSSRTWEHSMGGPTEAEPETIESMAAKAEWLKKRDD